MNFCSFFIPFEYNEFVNYSPNYCAIMYIVCVKILRFGSLWDVFENYLPCFGFLHDIYQFIGIIIYSIALLVNQLFDIGRKNKKNVLLWKKSLMKACKAEINILSLQSLSWIQSFYLKGLIPIEIECLSLWSVGHFFCFQAIFY